MHIRLNETINQQDMNPLDEPIDPVAPVNPPVWPVILKYGLIGAVVISLFNILFTKISVSISDVGSNVIASLIMTLVSLLIYVLIMVFSIRSYRDKHAQGYISLGKGMAISYSSAMIMGVLNVLLTLFYLLVIDPDLIARRNAAALAESGLPPSVISDLPQVSKLSIIYSQIGTFAIGCLVGGAIALVISAIMKKDRPYRTSNSTTYNRDYSK